jgi:anaerobic C4-dicarboxylate transporter
VTKMKYLEWLMFAIQMTVIAVVLWALFGCANTAMVEDAERETEYRKSLEKCCETYKSEGTGAIEMPQEWIDQWPELDNKSEK